MKTTRIIKSATLVEKTNNEKEKTKQVNKQKTTKTSKQTKKTMTFFIYFCISMFSDIIGLKIT